MAKRTIPPEPRSAQAFSTSNASQASSFRQLKVRKGYYPHQYHSKKQYSVPKPVPWVQIKGYWLNQAGFAIGTPLSVQVQNGCIIITPQASTT
jgi:toxic protein SymE